MNWKFSTSRSKIILVSYALVLNTNKFQFYGLRTSKERKQLVAFLTYPEPQIKICLPVINDMGCKNYFTPWGMHMWYCVRCVVSCTVLWCRCWQFGYILPLQLKYNHLKYMFNYKKQYMMKSIFILPLHCGFFPIHSPISQV